MYSTAGVNGKTSAAAAVKDSELRSAVEASSLVFTPNVIIHINSNSPLTRSDLKVHACTALLTTTNVLYQGCKRDRDIETGTSSLFNCIETNFLAK